MADLVTQLQLENELGLGAGAADAALLLLLDQVEAAFEADCGRASRPFQAAQNGRTERKDGTGTAVLYLDYPIAALTSVKLGYNAADPDEVLEVADQTKLVWDVGRGRLVRVDGGVFGCNRQPGYVTVVYNTQADLPADAARAVIHGTAVLYRQRGAEDASSESIGGTRAELIKAFEGDSVWQRAVLANSAEVVV